MIIVFHLHMYLTHIVATLADSLDSEFLQCHMAVNNHLLSIDSSVYRTVSTGGGFKLLARDVQSQAGNRTNPHPTGHLKIFQFDTVVLRTVCPCQYQNIIIVDILLLIGKFQELF